MSMISNEAVLGEKTVTLLNKVDLVEDSAKSFSFVRSVKWPGGVWEWVPANYPAHSFGRFHLDEAGNGYIVIVTEREIVDIYAIADLHKYKLVNLTKAGPKYDGRGTTAEERVLLKQKIAEATGTPYTLSAVEQMAYENMEETARLEAQNAIQTKRDEVAAKHAQKRMQSELVKQTVLTRPRLRGYRVETNAIFNGVPVVGDEWRKLDGGTYCVSVASYNDETKTHGEILGCFVVEKNNAREKKSRESQFSFTATTMKVSEKSIGEIAYRDDVGFHEVNVYESEQAVKQLQASGLNGGAIVAVKKSEIGDDGKMDFSLVRVTAKELKPIGTCRGKLIS